MSGRSTMLLGVLLLAAILAAHGWLDRQAELAGQAAARPANQDPLAGLSEAEAEFWRRVDELKPGYTYSKLRCPVDNTELTVPVRATTVDGKRQDNRLGGVATDLMKLALAPSDADPSAPDFSAQDWRDMLVTNPNTGATYIENDLVKIRMGYVPGASVKLRDWDLAALAPRLAETPQADWTWDERNLARYLTLRQAGQSGDDLAFAALFGAYAANHSYANGDPCRIPSAAFYALAAAHFEQALSEQAQSNGQMQQSTHLTFLAELRRLLGQFEQAQAAMDEAQALYTEINEELAAQLVRAGERTEQAQGIQRTLDSMVQVQALLDQIGSAIEAGNAELMRVELPGFPEPPPGWFIDELLPPINEHLSAHRGDWVNSTTPEEIVMRMIAEYETTQPAD